MRKIAAEQSPDVARADRAGPVLAHAAPFAAWLALMHFLDLPAVPAAVAYAIRTAVCTAILLWFRPWRWYSTLAVRNLPAAMVAGIAGYFIWVGPESEWVATHLPWLHGVYTNRIMNIPLIGGAPHMPAPPPYAPEICGWPLSIVRLLGSALVIAVIEEFFWRGFLYRWLVKEPFTSVDIGCWNTKAMAIMCLFFGLEHGPQWLVGILAGLIYAWVMIRTRDIWAAAFAHVITNLLLGLHVLAWNVWSFW